MQILIGLIIGVFAVMWIESRDIVSWFTPNRTEKSIALMSEQLERIEKAQKRCCPETFDINDN